jgi:prophage antirepressor-like protein
MFIEKELQRQLRMVYPEPYGTLPGTLRGMIVNLDGISRLAMFVRTEKARKFRDWALPQRIVGKSI